MGSEMCIRDSIYCLIIRRHSLNLLNIYVVQKLEIENLLLQANIGPKYFHFAWIFAKKENVLATAYVVDLHKYIGHIFENQDAFKIESYKASIKIWIFNMGYEKKISQFPN